MLTKRDIGQAILLGLFYVQSCAHPPPVNPAGDMYRGLMPPLPVAFVVTPQNREKDHTRLSQLLEASGPVPLDTDKARALTTHLGDILKSAKLDATQYRCYVAGCVTDVFYRDVQHLVDADRELVTPDAEEKRQYPRFPEGTPLFKGTGGRGRTPPRLENRQVVATWYLFTPPDDSQIQALKKKGFFNVTQAPY